MQNIKAKHMTFITQYISNGGKPRQAAIAAGYSPKSADSQASRLLKNRKIKDEIDRLLKTIAPECLVDHVYVITRLKEIVERCLQKAPVTSWDSESMEHEQKIDKAGAGVWTFDASGANKALELIGRHLKMFTDKLEVEVTDRAEALNKARQRALGGPHQ